MQSLGFVKATDWWCEGCSFRIHARKDRCKCGARRPGGSGPTARGSSATQGRDRARGSSVTQGRGRGRGAPRECHECHEQVSGPFANHRPVCRGGVAAGAPTDVFALVDVSGSMSGRRIQDAQHALIQLETMLGPADTLAVVEFSTQAAFRLTSRPAEQIRALNEMPGAVAGLRESARRGGGTALYDAIDLTVSQARKSRNRVVVIAVTDGQDNSSKTTLARCREMVAALPNITLFIVHIDGNGIALREHLELCTAAGGDSRVATISEELLIETVTTVTRRVFA